MIKQANMSGILQSLQTNASLQSFSASVVASPWASSHYGGNPDHIAQTQATGADIAAPDSAGSYNGGASMTTADWAALSAAGAQGGTAYLEALNAQGQSAASTAAASGPGGGDASTGADEQENIPGFGTVTATGQQADALATIRSTLSAYGFTPAQTNELTQWAWTEITNNVDPTQIAIDLQTPGTEGYQVFAQQFPGFTAANAQLAAQGLPAVSVQQYSSYQTQAMAFAQAAGLPPGFINSQNIGTLIGGNVSSTELQDRINNAMTLAINSTPEQQAMFNQYFGTNYAPNNPYITAGTPAPTGQGGLTTGQIAAIALDPTVAEPLIAQQITAAQIGGAGVTAGIGAVTAPIATELAQAGITEAQATNAFQSLAPYSALETPRPGMGGEAAQGVVNVNQLATGALLGDAGAQRQLQTAEEVAKAPFSGGGGFVSNTKGATGTGSASSSGAGNT